MNILQRNKIINMSKKNIILSVILFCLTVFWMCFIFSMSMQTAEESSAVSGGLLRKVLEIFHSLLWFEVDFQTLHNFFRKLAHFTEFFILGAFSNGFIKSIHSHSFIAGIYCLAVAFSDETIQYFTGSGRAAQIKDVMIDFSGSFTAILVFTAIACIIKMLKKNKLNKE